MFLSVQRYTLFRLMEFHHVAHTCHVQTFGKHAESANSQHITSPLKLRLIMCAVMHGVSFRRPQVLLPLLFNKNQSPLPTAECKMLQS